jgi:hypothetical protein
MPTTMIKYMIKYILNKDIVQVPFFPSHLKEGVNLRVVRNLLMVPKICGVSFST